MTACFTPTFSKVALFLFSNTGLAYDPNVYMIVCFWTHLDMYLHFQLGHGFYFLRFSYIFHHTPPPKYYRSDAAPPPVRLSPILCLPKFNQWQLRRRIRGTGGTPYERGQLLKTLLQDAFSIFTQEYVLLLECSHWCRQAITLFHAVHRLQLATRISACRQGLPQIVGNFMSVGNEEKSLVLSVDECISGAEVPIRVDVVSLCIGSRQGTGGCIFGHGTWVSLCCIYIWLHKRFLRNIALDFRWQFCDLSRLFFLPALSIVLRPLPVVQSSHFGVRGWANHVDATES